MQTQAKCESFEITRKINALNKLKEKKTKHQPPNAAPLRRLQPRDDPLSSSDFNRAKRGLTAPTRYSWRRRGRGTYVGRGMLVRRESEGVSLLRRWEGLLLGFSDFGL
ncbi:hypothetical protein ES332_D01G129000v1 [Gossypium tomentosum]|uniref:Uncharacterized protein n=1 Tax=Gossypium tomentosum TaxID=34277 RepID=A0A5D2M8H3_GOSTO|nr:hypothetical protein ES332_D01G129000v1 [Gossypium tomentosum]